MKNVILGWVFVAALGGCAPQHLYQRHDLQAALLKHHQNIRWGRLTQAAAPVQPELQRDFVQSWSAHIERLELHNVDVIGMSEAPGGDVVEVSVRLQWIDQQSMNMRSKTLTEVWVRTQEGWQVAAPVFPRNLLND